MTKPYSLDLRERVTERVAAGDRVRAVATIFTVSVASVVRWSQRLRRTGSAVRGKMGGHRACTLIGERGWLMERIAAEPEVTVRGLMTELASFIRKWSATDAAAYEGRRLRDGLLDK